MQQVSLLVGDGEAPLSTAHRGGEVASQPGVHRPPTGELTGVLITPEQGGQPHPQFPSRAYRAARRRVVSNVSSGTLTFSDPAALSGSRIVVGSGVGLGSTVTVGSVTIRSTTIRSIIVVAVGCAGLIVGPAVESTRRTPREPGQR